MGTGSILNIKSGIKGKVSVSEYMQRAFFVFVW